MSISPFHYSNTVNANLMFMIDNLSQDELEVAARTSFEYVQLKDPSPQMRQRAAMEMAERYLISKSDPDKALAKMKNTIKFRKELDVDALRDAATDPTSDDHVPLRKFLGNKKLYVSGFDNQGRSTYIFTPRLVDDHDPEWTQKGHVWSLERAIACSKAKDHTVNAIVDFDGFSALRNAPPMAVGKDIMVTLRDHYVGHVNQIFLINAPLAFLCLWKIFRPFAGKKTRDKINFVNSKRQQEQQIGSLYSTDQAASWMLPKGKKNRDLDLEEYLVETPFDRAFDEQ